MGREVRFTLTRRGFLFGAAAVSAGVGFAETSESQPPATRPSPDVPASLPFDKPPADALVGRVLYDGEPPARAVIDCSVDPHCALLYRKTPLMEETLVVSERRELQNVFVFVTKGLDKTARWPVPARPVVLDQKGCRYIPHVFGVMAGQPLEIVNSSKINEVPHGFPERNPEFSFTLAKKGMKQRVVLTEPEAFKILCDVHPWEIAWCHVVDHPFYATTDAMGRFMIRGLKPGEYELAFWHEHGSLGVQNKVIKVESDKATRLDDVSFKPRKKRRPPGSLPG